MVTIGDSKTVGLPCCQPTNGFQDELLATIRAEGQRAAITSTLALTSRTVSDILALMPAFLNGNTSNPQWVLINLGTNDVLQFDSRPITHNQWLLDYGQLLDLAHAHWPAAQLRIMRVYFGPPSTALQISHAQLIDSWMDEVVAPRATFAAVGPDERAFLPGNTGTDQTHPNANGYSLTAAQWRVLMGF